jgi:hypothetical protein
MEETKHLLLIHKLQTLPLDKPVISFMILQDLLLTASDSSNGQTWCPCWRRCRILATIVCTPVMATFPIEVFLLLLSSGWEVGHRPYRKLNNSIKVIKLNNTILHRMRCIHPVLVRGPSSTEQQYYFVTSSVSNVSEVQSPRL